MGLNLAWDEYIAWKANFLLRGKFEKGTTFQGESGEIIKIEVKEVNNTFGYVVCVVTWKRDIYEEKTMQLSFRHVADIVEANHLSLVGRWD